MIAYIINAVLWLVIGALVGWNLLAQPKIVKDTLDAGWSKITDFIATHLKWR